MFIHFVTILFHIINISYNLIILMGRKLYVYNYIIMLVLLTVDYQFRELCS